MTKTYRVVEIFKTIQGEGARAGTVAVFVRFVGCNLWSGHDKHRARDAERNNAKCPIFCDTDFRKGTAYTAAELVDTIWREDTDNGKVEPCGGIVFTGGEPLLQLDEELMQHVRRHYPGREGGTVVALETNGTIAVPQPAHWANMGIDWICVSPKTPAADIKQRFGNELKVVFPAYNPLAYGPLGENFTHRFVSPEAVPQGVGVSVIDKDVMARAARFVIAHPRWRISLQTHKLLGVR